MDEEGAGAIILRPQKRVYGYILPDKEESVVRVGVLLGCVGARSSLKVR